MLAIWKTGNTYIPIDDGFPYERAAFIIRDSGASGIYTTSAMWGRVRQDFPDLQFVNCFEDLPASDQGVANNTVSAVEAAYILYTSGTTGVPKGVMVSYGSIDDYVHTFITYFSISQTDVVVQQASVSFDTSLEEILPILCKGGRLVIAEKGGSDIEQLVEIIRREQVTVVSTTPLVIKELNKERLPECLRAVISGGDNLRPEHITRLPKEIKIYNTYGPTETTICATYKEVAGRNELIGIGIPNRNRRVYLLDDSLELVPEGAIGEICISGKGVAIGYVNNKEEEARRFVQDPFMPGERMYRTGDMAYWNTEGELMILGRKDNQIKIRGYRVELKEVESRINSYDRIEEAVVRCELVGGEPQLIAYYLPVRPVVVEDLQAYLGRFLPTYMLPAIYIKLDAFPLLHSGKIHIASLSAHLDTFLNTCNTFVSVDSQTEARLLEIWSIVLEAENIGVMQNFFSLGGNSIKAMRMIGMINDSFGKELTIQEVFNTPTIRGLSAMLEDKEIAALSDNGHTASDGFFELSHAQKRIWLLHQVNGNGSSANISAAIALQGEMDTRKFKQAYHAVIAKYEILRTSFAEKGLSVGQVVTEDPDEAYFLEEIDMRESADPQKAALSFVQEQSKKAFRLDKLPLARGYLIREDHTSFIFFLSVHHIIADGWSMKLIFEDLFTGYNRLCAGSSPDNENPDHQYRDFAAWHNRQVEEYGRYWINLYSNGVPDTLLPEDFSRTSQPVYHGDVVKDHIDAGLIESLQKIAASTNTTLDVILFAAYSMVIAGWCNQFDIVIGLLVSGRNRLITRNMVGVFINNLPIRVTINPEQQWAEFVQEQHRRLIEAISHQDYPFDLMVENIEGARFKNRNAFYQTLFNYQVDESYIEEMQVTGLAVEKLPFSFNDSMIDIQLNLSKRKDGMTVEFSYNATLYKRNTIETLNQQLRQLLGNIAGGIQGKPYELLAAVGLPLRRSSTGSSQSRMLVKCCSSFVMEPIAEVSNYWSEQTDLSIQTEFSRYNQVIEFLLNEENCYKGKEFGYQVTVICIRLGDWVRFNTSLSPEKTEKILNDVYCDLKSVYENFIQKCDHPVIALIAPEKEHNELPATRRWREYLSGRDHAIVIDMSDLIVNYELENIFDPVADEMAHMPFTEEVYTAVGTEIFRVLYAQAAKPYKVIVLDGDNTLWSGICGEDPPEQIVIDEGYSYLQDFMIEKYDQGFLLAINSKNNEADFWRTFDHHPRMKLKRHHIIAHRINWRSKSENIASIAAELNLGLDSFIFIDDSAHEHEEVKTRRPEVLSLQLPADSSRLKSFLKHSWAFDRYRLTKEDLKRNEHYRAEMSRKELQASSTSIDDYITSLNVRVDLGYLAEDHLERVSQLAKRTNQFNANGIEWSKDELKEFISLENNIARVVHVEDRFGDYGLVGLVLLRRDADTLLVESMLLSCRVLGRKVEYYIKRAIEKLAEAEAIGEIKIKAWETGRNVVFFQFLKDAGWAELLLSSNIQNHEKG